MTDKDFINSRKELASSYFTKGFNCAQSVSLAFCDVVGESESKMLMLSSPFGGGMGQLREVCGAVSGMLIIEGLVSGYDSPADKEEKKRVYTETKSLALQFKEKCGSIICRELLAEIPHSTDGTPADRTEEYYKKRPCKEIVEIAAEIIANHIISVKPELLKAK